MATGNGEAFPQESHAIDPIDLSAWRQMESELPADWEPISLQQTSEKDELAQVRLQNASATLSSIDRDKPDVTADVYYKAGIVAQMALTSFLLHRGFDDHWCARNIRLRITTALDWANASGLNHMNPGICRLAVALTPYWKWRRLGNRLLLQRGGLRFKPGEIHEILSNLLEHTRAMVPMKAAAEVESSAGARNR